MSFRRASTKASLTTVCWMTYEVGAKSIWLEDVFFALGWLRSSTISAYESSENWLMELFWATVCTRSYQAMILAVRCLGIRALTTNPLTGVDYCYHCIGRSLVAIGLARISQSARWPGADCSPNIVLSLVESRKSIILPFMPSGSKVTYSIKNDWHSSITAISDASTFEYAPNCFYTQACIHEMRMQRRRLVYVLRGNSMSLPNILHGSSLFISMRRLDNSY